MCVFKEYYPFTEDFPSPSFKNCVELFLFPRKLLGEFHLNSYYTNVFQTQDHENGMASGIKRCCPLKDGKVRLTRNCWECAGTEKYALSIF